jgi:hypothetical protein
MRCLALLLLLAALASAHPWLHAGVSAGSVYGLDKMLEACKVKPAIVLPLAMAATAAAGVAWEAYWHRRNGAPIGLLDLACNAAGIAAGVGVTVGLNWMRRTR